MARLSSISQDLSLDFSRHMSRQIAQANLLVKVALEGIRRSGDVLELTGQLRFAALNVFVKTERNQEQINVFAPISTEFMTLVRGFEELTREFSEESNGFVCLLMDFVKAMRRHQQLVMSICFLTLARRAPEVSDGDVRVFLKQFFSNGTGTLSLSGVPYNDFPTYYAAYRGYCDELAACWEGIRHGQVRLRRIGNQLSTLSSLGEYAVQVATVEASRLDGREDLLAAFKNIDELLGKCLGELKFMRSWFSQGIRIIDSLNWEIGNL